MNLCYFRLALITLYKYVYQLESVQLYNFHFSLNESWANSADPDQTPHNVASDQVLHCLLTGVSINNRIKATK